MVACPSWLGIVNQPKPLAWNSDFARETSPLLQHMYVQSCRVIPVANEIQKANFLSNIIRTNTLPGWASDSVVTCLRGSVVAQSISLWERKRSMH